MAELGIVANVVGVVGAGLQLSVALYDFASNLGSAGREIEDMGYDITLLCAVLKRVQSTLDSPRSTRLSVTAIQTTQDIVNRCQKILDDINSILKKLRKDGQTNVDILARVRWTLKRPKILLLRGSLQSCTTTLHLMLSTIDWARNATRRSIIGEPDPEDDQDRQMTHSLFLAQQSANHRLEELEDRAMNEAISGDDSIPSPDSLEPPPVLSSRADMFARRKTNRSSIMIDSVVYPASIMSTFTGDKRTSVLLNECIFEADRSFDSVTGGLPRPLDHRQSIVYSEALLRRWTKQIDFDPSRELDLDLDLPSNQAQLLFEPKQERSLLRSGGPGSDADDELETWDEQNLATTAPPREDRASDKIAIPSFIGDDELVKTPITQTLPLSSIPVNEIFKSFRINLEDPGYKVLPAAVQKYSATLQSKGYPLDWRQYALYVVYGDQERAVGLDEKPLALFKNLDREGKMPMFMLRYLVSSEPQNTNPESLAKFPADPNKDNDPGSSAPIGRTPFTPAHVHKGQAGDNSEPQSSNLIDGFSERNNPQRPPGIDNPSLGVGTSKSVAVPPGFGFDSSYLDNANSGAAPEAVAHSNTQGNSSPTAPVVSIFKSFRVSVEDPCYKVLPAALKKYQIFADWRAYDLYIVYGDVERRISHDEKPLAIFKDLDREGKKPMFMIRKIPETEGEQTRPDAEAKSNQAQVSKEWANSSSPSVGRIWSPQSIEPKKVGSGTSPSPSPN